MTERDDAASSRDTKLFKTTVKGIGPWCVEFVDGEIITSRDEQRARLIAATLDQQQALLTAPWPPENFSALPPARLIDWAIAYRKWWNEERAPAIAKAIGAQS
jgi:hypothetical protein